MDLPSTKPYLLRALWEWCCDNGFTPYLSVVVDSRTRVPREFVRDGQIVLNVGPEATNRLQIGNELVEFQARFGGVARELSVPIEQVAAIYARENGAGMAFEVGSPAGSPEVQSAELPRLEPVPAGAAEAGPRAPDDPRPEGGRPHLQRIK
ncbi:MAG: ClpXP protease specificity-enhancing factor [Dechloromonas sp.]|jgi:stringent starvation protein B|nr:ClpXP protease specificity-enhancing factor [Dechloromonas sp.]